jgi:hypothetical protein
VHATHAQFKGWKNRLWLFPKGVIMGKTPNATHRMKRKQPKHAKPGRRVLNIKEAYTKEQLTEIGAITLTWNQIKHFIEWLLLVVLKIPVRLWTAVAARISGVDAKLEILTLRASQSEILTDEARACIKSCFEAVLEYKNYRNAIVHSNIFDIDKGLAVGGDRRGQAYEVLITIEALNALYERLVIILDELPQIDLLFRLADEFEAATIYPQEANPSLMRRNRDVPVMTKRVLQHQARRLALPPLPEFPKEPPTPTEALLH